MTRSCNLWVLLLVLAAGGSRADGTTITGRVDAYIDGDTFVVSDETIRLKGIDAPETAQQCVNARGREYSCGDRAAGHLSGLVAGQAVICRGAEKDEYDRLIAYCHRGSLNLNAQMVRDGWAVAFVRFDDSFINEEKEARRRQRGIWQGQFQRPADFRAAGWQRAGRQTDTQNGDCPIKGNINSKGERIYHTPWGSKHYKRTRIDTARGERWFCSEAEAKAAGWRPPIR